MFLSACLGLLPRQALADNNHYPSGCLHSSSVRNAAIADSLSAVLKTRQNVRDSLRVMYDIFDVSSSGRQKELIDQMYPLARRANDIPACLDLIRNYCRLHSDNDSALAYAQDLATGIPAGSERSETLSFIRLLRTRLDIDDPSVEVRRLQIKRLSDLMRAYRNIPDSEILKRTEKLFAICYYLNSAAPGDLLTDKLAELQGLVDRLPSDEVALASLYYDFAIDAHIRLDDRSEVVIQSCQKYLELLDNLEKNIRSRGRRFYTNDSYCYAIYERLLSMYPELAPGQVEEYYSEICDIIAGHPTIARMFSTNRRPEIFHLMSRGDYAGALRIFRDVMDKPATTKGWNILFPMYVRAAKAVGDTKDRLHAQELYNASLLARARDKVGNAANELQILYNTSNLHYDNDDLAARNQALANQSRDRLMLFMWVFVILLVLLIIVLGFAWRRARLMELRLRRVNESIATERDTLRKVHENIVHANEHAKVVDRKKNDIMQNITREIASPTNAIVSYAQLVIDSVDETHRVRLQEYIKVVRDNSQLLQSLVNDLLDSADAEHARINVSVNNFSLGDAVRIAAATMRDKLAEGVVMNIQDMTPDVSDRVDSDSKRVEQIILNLLLNAAKFTPRGHIDVEYSIDRTTGTATVSVSDTGPGIPKGKEEIIFSRFEKLNPGTQGIGLGLYVCRAMAGLIGGSICVDTSYTLGARFVFTFPISGNTLSGSGSKNIE